MSSSEGPRALIDCARERRVSAEAHRKQALATPDASLRPVYEALATNYENQARELDLMAARIDIINVAAERTRTKRDADRLQSSGAARTMG
jgi:hypothetical protein